MTSKQVVFDPTPRPRGLRAFIGALAVVGVMLAGCSAGRRDAPVDAARARDALKITLEGWKKGDPPDGLRDGGAPIAVQDMDWSSGSRLVRYEVTGEGKEELSNLHIPVKLTLKTRQGKEVTKSVTYMVGTSPNLTVYRGLH